MRKVEGLLNENDAMQKALALAERGRGWVEPNPMVGAVILRDGEVVGEGWHERFGEAHAEVNAIADARAKGVDVAGLTMAVTLEPCCHTGKTGPCAQALIEAKVKRVVVAMVDPDERVAGRGIALLKKAGIEVEVGVCEAEARRLNEAFIKRVERGLPWVIAKWAQTVDGKTATANGDSQWISNEQSRAVVHRLRSQVDAVMVGVGTVIADDPSLTARLPEGEVMPRVARRLVADHGGRMPRDAKMLSDGGPAVEVLRGGLREELSRLSRDGVSNVLVEGGARLVGAMMGAGLVDQLLVFVGPRVVGDAAALPAVAGMGCERMGDALGLELVEVERLGGDVVLDYRVVG